MGSDANSSVERMMPLERFSGYASNALRVSQREARHRLRMAEKRLERWEKSYGPVGAYRDLVAVVEMMVAVNETLTEIERKWTAAGCLTP